MQSLWKWISRHLPNFLFELAEIGYNIPAWLHLRRALAQGRYDLVYERYAFFLLAGSIAARRQGIPFVLEANEVSGIAGRARRQTFPRLCAWFERSLFRRCTAIHTVSSRLRDMILAQRVPAEKIHVAPNAFDVRRVSHVRRDPSLTERLHLNGKRVIGFAGWFDHWDRLDLFVDVFRELHARHPQLHLLLIGDGPVLHDVRQRIDRYGLRGQVTLTGAVSRTEIYAHLAQLDIAVLPHSNDFGSPVVMFEFMALGIPVVAPRLPPIEDVHRDGDTALLFHPLDVAGCVHAIERLIVSDTLRREIAARARARLEANHTWHRNASLILESAGLTAPVSASSEPAGA
jgi:glycosyltransferase involved in cell wall biosynthesis